MLMLKNSNANWKIMAFATRERAEQEQMRLMKQQQELQALQQKLSDELASENQKNSLQLRDSINSFLKIYNQNKGYDLIISNTGFDNLLYANPAYNITQEIIDGLNARYTPSSVKNNSSSTLYMQSRNSLLFRLYF